MIDDLIHIWLAEGLADYYQITSQTSQIVNVMISAPKPSDGTLRGLCSIWHAFQIFDPTFKNPGEMVTHYFCVPGL